MLYHHTRSLRNPCAQLFSVLTRLVLAMDALAAAEAIESGKLRLRRGRHVHYRRLLARYREAVETLTLLLHALAAGQQRAREAA